MKTKLQIEFGFVFWPYRFWNNLYIASKTNRISYVIYHNKGPETKSSKAYYKFVMLKELFDIRPIIGLKKTILRPIFWLYIGLHEYTWPRAWREQEIDLEQE